MSKLFDKWDLDEVKVEDLGLVKYICLDETLVPHTSGRHVKRQFAKSKVSIVERLMNKVMRTHLNSGKKNKAYNIVKEALEATVSRVAFVSYEENTMTGTYVRLPERSDVLPDIRENLIVEFYNK